MSQAQAQVLYEGVPVYLHGQIYVVPSLSVRQFREHYAILTQPPTGDDEAAVRTRFNALVPVIGAALRRNYPEVTDEQLEDWLDVRTFPLALRAVQNASGLEVVRPGEATA